MAGNIKNNILKNKHIEKSMLILCIQWRIEAFPDRKAPQGVF